MFISNGAAEPVGPGVEVGTGCGVGLNGMVGSGVTVGFGVGLGADVTVGSGVAVGVRTGEGVELLLVQATRATAHTAVTNGVRMAPFS